MNEEKLCDLLYDLLHVLRENKAIDRKQFSMLFKSFKESELS